MEQAGGKLPSVAIVEKLLWRVHAICHKLLKCNKMKKKGEGQ
jgi:hypothetical protein